MCVRVCVDRSKFFNRKIRGKGTNFYGGGGKRFIYVQDVYTNDISQFLEIRVHNARHPPFIYGNYPEGV